MGSSHRRLETTVLELRLLPGIEPSMPKSIFRLKCRKKSGERSNHTVREFGWLARIPCRPRSLPVLLRRETGRAYVSPYNDWEVVAGQGTIGVELTRQIENIDAIFIATGGGGLISGVGAYLRERSPRTEIVGCWPENSRVLYESLRAGAIIEFPEGYTISESTAGGVESGSITFPLARAVMHRGVLVSEEAILDAMKWARLRGWTIEGSAGVALAAFFQEASRYEGKTVVVLFCGGNLSPEVQRRMQ